MPCKCLDLTKKAGVFKYKLKKNLYKSTTSDSLRDLGDNVYIDKNLTITPVEVYKDIVNLYRNYAKAYLCKCTHKLIDSTPVVLCTINNKKGFTINNFTFNNAMGYTQSGIILLDIILISENIDLMKTVFFHEIAHLLDFCARCPLVEDGKPGIHFSDQDIFIKIHNLLTTRKDVWQQFLHDYKKNINVLLKELNLDKDIFFEDNWHILAQNTRDFLINFLSNPKEVFACFNHFICVNRENASVFINFTNIKDFFEKNILNIYNRRDPSTAQANTQIALNRLGVVFATTFQNFILDLFKKELSDLCLPYIKKFNLIENCNEEFIEPDELEIRFAIYADEKNQKIIDGEKCPKLYYMSFDFNPRNLNYYCCNSDLSKDFIPSYEFPLYSIDTCDCYKNNDKKCFLLFSNELFQDTIKDPQNMLSTLLYRLYSGCVGVPIQNNKSNYLKNNYINPISQDLLIDFYDQLKDFLIKFLNGQNIFLIDRNCEIIK